MKYDSMGISVTNECDISCSMCCQSNNQPLGVVEYKKISEYIKSAKDTPIKYIGFSGGEAFLHFDLLKDLISLSSALGKSSTVMTNGFWASDYSKTENYLSELKKAGLNSCGLSYDEFHAKYVHEENIKNIIRAAKKIKLHVTIQSVILKDSNIGEWINKIGNVLNGISVLFTNCHPVGRAAKNIGADRYIRALSSRGLLCVKNGIFSVGHTGVIRPCCFPEISETELEAGNIGNQNVLQTLKTLKNNPYLYLLRNYGFDYFINIVEKNALDITIPEQVVSNCELCALFFAKDNYQLLSPYVNESVRNLKKDLVSL
ncbi:MAG: radical SAM protein [Defluviitaleaceae bacterium]|nr:radical SAM protein [Defluviitaleaceae bacterium]